MKILVTGATGLLGANVVRVLLEREMGEVRVLVRPSASRVAIDGLPVEIVAGDVEDAASVANAARGCGALFHVAGIAEAGGVTEERLWAVNVAGTENACRAAQAVGARLVHTSSASAIDAAPPGELADENTRSGTLGRGTQPYARSKKAAEGVVLRAVSKGLDAVIVSPTLMFGEWDVKPTSGKMIVLAARGPVPIYPVGGGNVIDVRDAAVGHAEAFRRGKSGERYILGHENLSYRELLAIVRAVVGRGAPFIPLWPGPAMAAAWLARPILRRIGGAAAELFTPEAIAASARSHYTSPAKAVRDLGLPQSPVEAAIDRAARWLRDRGYFK